MSSPGGVEVDRVSVRVVPNTSSFADDLRVELAKIEREVELSLRTSIDTTRLVEETRLAVDEAQLAAPTIDLKAKVDTSQVSELKTSLLSIPVAAAQSAAGLFTLGNAAALLGPAIVPLGAALAGLTATLGSVAAAGAAGLGIFGVISAGAIAKATADSKQITALQQKIAASTGAAHAQYVAQLRNLESGIPQAEQGLINSFGSIKQAFNDLLLKVGSDVFKPLEDAINLVAKLMPKLTPVIVAFGTVLDGLVRQFGRFAETKQFTAFIAFIADTGSKAFVAFAKILGNVALGVAGFMQAFAPLGSNILTSILKATQAFAQMGQNATKSKGIQSFLDYFRANGKHIADILGELFKGIGQAIVDLAPAGTAVLSVLDAVTTAIGNMKGVAGPLVALLAGLFLPFIGGGPVGVVLGLAAAFGELYKNSKQFRGIVNDVWSGLQKFGTVLGGVIQGVVKNAPGIFAAFNQSIAPIKTAFGGVVSAISGLATALEPIVKTIASVVIQNWPQIAQVAKQVWGTVRQIIVTALDYIDLEIKAVTAVIQFVWRHFGDIITSVVKGVFPAVLNIISGVLKVIQSLFKAFDDAIHGRWSNVWADLGGVVKGAFKIVEGLLGVSSSIVLGLVRAAGRIGKAIVDGIITGLKNAAGGIKDALFNGVKGAMDWVKHKFGIHSPSTVFADEVGAHIASGIAMGIDTNSHLVRAATFNAIKPPNLGVAAQTAGVGGNGRALVNIERLEAHDYKDFLRQSHQRLVAAGGGGVSM